MANIIFPPLQNAIQKTLDSQLLEGVTASMTLNNVVGIGNRRGVCVVDYVDANGQETPTKREYIIFEGVSGNTLTDLTRNADGGSTDQDHSVGAIVQFPSDVLQQEEILAFFTTEHDNTGKHTSALITTLKASGSDVNTGTNDTKIVTPKALSNSDYVKSSQIEVTPSSTTTFTNKDLSSPTNTFPVGLYANSLYYQAIINGGFTINQRVYVSNATLTAGSYGHDRWKAGASGGDYTFTQLNQATQITIKSGKSLIQVVEDKNVIGGDYVLSWEGTAQGRVGINSATPSGSYANSPIIISGQTAGTVMSVEFNEGTLGKVVLNSGLVALPYMPKSFNQELLDCMRYYEKSFSYETAPSTGTYNKSGNVWVAGLVKGVGAATTVFFKVPKRNVPVITTWNKNTSTTGTTGLAFNELNTGVGDNGKTDGFLGNISNSSFAFSVNLSANYDGIVFGWEASADL